MTIQSYRLLFIFSWLLAVVNFGCAEETKVGDVLPKDGTYQSYNPGSAYDHGYDAEGSNDSNNANNTAPPESTDEERALEEADIIKLEGNTLYALSAYRGLVVLDLTTQDQIEVLGRFPVYGRPFEMYIREGLAYIMFSSFWVYSFDEDLGYGTWNSTSRLVVLDVNDPANITEVASYDLAGEVSDSRLVGDILYMVAGENGYCWHCSDTPRTTVTSVSTGDLNDIQLVDQLSFESASGWYNMPIHVTPDRIYVASYDYETQRSEVQIVDISDPSGVMSLGAAVSLAGRIESRWQMSEYNGVFRTISQRGWSSLPPVVETFAVAQSNVLLPLGSLTMTLPRPEDLRSVRFDGTTAYAVTFEQIDPLFVIDLSAPATPVQRGELEIPGWLHHMEPRGDRMIALGFDTEQGRQLTMSLFDTSDLDNPIMLARENFGAEYSWLTEDQDRIHKALKIIDDMGLILMPYAGWGNTGYASGVQLFTFTNDTLAKRGLMPHYGYARRAFAHNGRLFAMSDERIEAFDYADLDNPVKTATRVMARAVYNFTPFGDGYIAQLSMDWWSREARLDITTESNPDAMDPVASITLTDLFGSNSPYYYWYYGFSYARTKLFARGNHVFLVRGESPWGYWDEERDEWLQGEYIPTQVLTFDVSNPAAPALVATTNFPYQFPWQIGYWYSSTVESGTNIVMVGDTIVLKPDNWWYYDQNQDDPAIYGISVADPLNPVISFEIARQEGVVYGGLQSKGDLLVTSHFTPLFSDPESPQENMVLFYMDRIDLSDADAPSFLPQVNIPGSLIDFNPTTSKIVTVDYTLNRIMAHDSDSCYYAGHYNAWYDYDLGMCYWVDRSLDILNLFGNTAVIAGIKVYNDGYISSVKATDTRIFVQLSNNYWWWYYDESESYDPRPLLKTIEVNGLFTYPTTSSIRLPVPWSTLQAAQGTSAVVIGNSPPNLTVYDASDPHNVEISHDELLTGYSYGIHMDPDRIISANSMWGVQVINY